MLSTILVRRVLDAHLLGNTATASRQERALRVLLDGAGNGELSVEHGLPVCERSGGSDTCVIGIHEADAGVRHHWALEVRVRTGASDVFASPVEAGSAVCAGEDSDNDGVLADMLMRRVLDGHLLGAGENAARGARLVHVILDGAGDGTLSASRGRPRCERGLGSDVCLVDIHEEDAGTAADWQLRVSVSNSADSMSAELSRRTSGGS